MYTYISLNAIQKVLLEGGAECVLAIVRLRDRESETQNYALNATEKVPLE